jgi:tetratricopeptide (TPR) repeat protein
MNSAAEGRRTIEEISYDIFQYPNNVALYLERILGYIDLDRYDDALNDATTVIELEPSAGNFAGRGTISVNAFFSQSMIRYPNRVLLLQNAIRDLNRAIELDTEKELYYYTRGAAYVFLGELENAIIDLTKAIEVDQRSADAYALRGYSYIYTGQLQKAMEDTSMAIKLSPNDPRYFGYRGTAYENLGERELALRDFTRALELNGDYTDAYNNRSMIYFKMGNYQEALNDLIEYIKREPTANAYKGLGRTYQGLADQEIDNVKKAEYQRKAEENFAIAERMGETR